MAVGKTAALRHEATLVFRCSWSSYQKVARENISTVLRDDASDCSMTLMQDDMMSFVCSGAAPAFDAALASFSAHHLRGAEEKGRFLGGVRRHLKTGSTLYVVDVFREAQEDREVWLQRFLAFVRETWTSLDPEELDLFVVHISIQDFPEGLATYQRIADEAGSSAVDALATDDLRLLGSIALRA